MPLIAITGGIGAGKSEVTRLLEEWAGAESIDADRCARELLENDREVAREVRAAFGPGVFNGAGRVDRPALRGAVFGREASRRALEAILHPRIRAMWSDWASARRAGGEILLLVEIPLLYETGAASRFDHAVVVGCAPETQLRRLTAGRGLSQETAERMIASQWPIEHKIAACDSVVWNDGSRSALQRQTLLCLSRLRGAPNSPARSIP